MFKGLIYSFIILLASNMAYAEKHVQYCDSAKEYITVLEFLRDGAKESKSSVELSNRKIADEVSKYCDGAARRFIKVVRLFGKLNIGMVNALPVAKKAAGVEDEKVKLFVNVLKDLYLKDGLDLSIRESLNVAELYLQPSKISAKKMLKEFKEMNSFCRSDRGMSRNKLACAKLTQQILAGIEAEKEEIAEDFIKNYKYLRGRRLFLSSFDAIKLSKELIGYGPVAIKTYHRALKYAMNKKGLNLQKPDALKFAMDMAKRSKVESERKLKSDTDESFWSFL